LSNKLFLPVILIIVLILLAVSACSNQAGANSSLIKPTWITAEISTGSVSIPVSEVDKDIMTHFKVNTPTDEYVFMAYNYAGKTYVRANVCVPCGSEKFSLKGNTLVCGSCGTVFDAQTGKGISGVKACQGYPKQPVEFQVNGGNILMKGTDLTTAFLSTLNPKKQ
jgi:nitrite reductase/ring-hydroxylating ferredoxin subunit